MRAIGNWFFLIAMSVLLGSVLFFSFIATPILKAELGGDAFYMAVTVIFPVYFQSGIVVATIALLIAIVRTLRTDYPKHLLKWINLSLVVMLALNIVGLYVLLPPMQELAPDFAADEFIQYYNFAQGASLLNLLLGLQVLLFVAIDMRILPGKPSSGGYSMRF